MSGRWLLANRVFFVRDLVRDYCLVFQQVAAQKRRFERDGAVSYSALRDLLGEAMRKGVFWRLKDTAHHLFRTPVESESGTAGCFGLTSDAGSGLNAGLNAGLASAQAHELGHEEAVMLWQYAGSVHPDGMSVQRPVEALIDWCVGYAFHECAKLKEDAFQGRHYATRLAQLSRLNSVTGELYDPLDRLTAQTAESSSRELSRILHVLSHGLFLLTHYLAAESENTRLARWLAIEENLAREVFGELYPALLTALYGDAPQRLYVLAAQDFLEAGRREPARVLLARARSEGLSQHEAEALLRQIPSAEDGVDAPDAGTLCAGCGKCAEPRAFGGPRICAEASA